MPENRKQKEDEFEFYYMCNENFLHNFKTGVHISALPGEPLRND